MASSSSSNYLSPTPVPRRTEWLMNWPFNLESYSPVSTFGNDVAAKLSDFENSQLSKESSVQYIRYTKHHCMEEHVLTEELSKMVSAGNEENMHEIFFINRFIMRPGTQNPPKDIKRLRISKIAFRSLLSIYEIPPAFVASMMSTSFASLPFQHRQLALPKSRVLDFFYILPVRAGLDCTDGSKSHALSSAGSNQADPSEYLHLSEVSRDIRPSKIAVFSQHNEETHQTTTICINFQDGRWSELAEEPLLRTKEVLGYAERAKKNESPFFFHLLLLTSVAEWWRRALIHFNSQIIACEKQLQLQVYRFDSTPDEFINETNKALHIMIAHLHRYKTEIDLLVEIATSLSALSKCSCTAHTHTAPSTSASAETAEILSGQSHSTADAYFNGITSELKSTRNFVLELESKTETVLGLLFNNMRSANDRLMVANGDAMRQILAATSAETKLSRKMAKQSQKMAMDMRRDSTSMKTIAIMTMFFLPATSFAAVLSMPFFSQSTWMGEVDSAWLWVALSVPSTAIAFAIFYMYTRRGDREIMRNDDVELDSVAEQA